MAKAFVSRGYNLISNGTDNHLMLIDLRNKNITGKKAQETLDKAHITLNKNAVPFDDKSPFVTSRHPGRGSGDYHQGHEGVAYGNRSSYD